jgi:hypothetical protein
MEEQKIQNGRAGDERFGFNPISRRYVLRTGAIWKRLVKAGTVVDEEVAAQLAKPAQGTPRKRHNNVTIAADRDAVGGIVRDHFDASRLTGQQLQQIAAEVARLQVASPKPRGRARKAGPQYDRDKSLYRTTGVSHRRAPPPTSDDQTDEDDCTETTACDESQSDAPDACEVAKNITARFSAIRVQKPPLRRR